MKPQPYIFDMETSDPDDFLTLLLLLGHPEVDLIAVTITPGTREQVGIVRQALSWFGRDIPVGAFDIDHVGNCVSEWHYKAFPALKRTLQGRPDKPPAPTVDTEPGWKVLEACFSEDVTLVCGAALKNLGALLQHLGDTTPKLGRAFIQGGFAGEGVVPSEKQMEKFKGMVTCPTFNLNGDPKSALLVLEKRKWFSDLRFIGKQVCHRVKYDQTMHDRFKAVSTTWCDHEVCNCECHRAGSYILHVMACCSPCSRCGQNVAGYEGYATSPKSLSQSLIYQGMTQYLGRHKDGKAFHDPLAACCAINPSIGTWASVELYRERGEWGSYLMPASGVRIITDYDHEKFCHTLLGGKTDVFSNTMMLSLEDHADHLGIQVSEIQMGDRIGIGAAIISHASGEFLNDIMELPPRKTDTVQCGWEQR